MADPRRATEPDDQDQGASAVEPLDPIIVSAREGAFRAFRVVGTIVGVVSVVSVLPGLRRGAPVSGALWAVLVLALAFALLSWLLPARRSQITAGLLLAAVGLIAILGTWSIGPTFPMGALFVVVPLLATLFYGRRLLVPGAVAVALVLAGVGVASWLAGRPTVGDVEGARVPYLIYARVALTTFFSVLLALAFVHAVLGAMERSIERARAAAQLAAEEQERRLAAERELARANRLEEIGRLASGVAHDTKNALLVLSAGVKELQASVRDPAQREILSDLEHAVAGVGSTVQQLLSLARRQPSSARPVALAAQVGQFASALRRVLPPDVELRVEGQSAAQTVVDPALLEQALLNLALNARDAMPGGGRLTLRLQDRADGRVVVEVEDSGTGMEPATAARMFDPFFTTKADGAGTGLGLHRVRSFVQGAGGAVEVDSALGQGTRVRLCFPVVAQARSRAVGR